MSAPDLTPRPPLRSGRGGERPYAVANPLRNGGGARAQRGRGRSGGTCACALMSVMLIAFLLTSALAHAASLRINCVQGDPVAHGELLRNAVGMLEPGDTLIMGGGVYALSEPLVLTPAQSGVAIAAADGAEVVIRGSRGVSGWQPWRDGIYVADLAAQGLVGARFHQLFLRGERQHLARYPNFAPQHPRTGGFVYVWDQGERPSEQFVYAEDDLPLGEWADTSQAEVHSIFGFGWNIAITPIVEIDRERRVITTERPRRPWERMNRYFVQNVLGALDAPGEWFLDFATDRLYFMPPGGIAPADGDVTVPVTDSVIELRGALPYPHEYLVVGFGKGREEASLPDGAPEPGPIERVILRGLTVGECRQDGIVLTGARECSVVGCTVRNVGNVGVNLGAVANAEREVGNPRITPAEGFSGGVGGGGQNILFNDPCLDCRVVGCDVSDCGADGIFLYGDRNVAENNHVSNTGLYDMDCACVNLWGEANVARRNTLHDAPRNAVFLKGVDNLVELNDLRWTMLETCDGGAIRMCQRNLALRGNVIRHNRILDTVGYGYPRASRLFQSPYYSWGVYLDDFTCGTTIEGNIIARVGRSGVMVHGGSDNTVRGNIVVDAPIAALEQAPIRDDPIAGNLFAGNVLVHDIEDALVYRSTKWVEGSLSIARNLAWTYARPAEVSLGFGGEEFADWEAWLAHGLDEGSVLAPPQFAAPEADDYRLADGSPAWGLGFERIPVEQIGCYASDERASWPVAMDAGVAREEPVLYEQPARPVREDFELDRVGAMPRHGDAMEDGAGRIRATDELAAEGERSLKITDAPNLRQIWLPRIYYPLDHRSGRVRVAFDLRLSAEAPPELYVDPRQYSETGKAEYFSGPRLNIAAAGTLSGAGGALATLPLDWWVRLELLLTLGADAPASTPLTITVQGEEPVTVEVQHVSPQFRRLERLVFASTTDGDAAWWLDNVVVEAVGD